MASLFRSQNFGLGHELAHYYKDHRWGGTSAAGLLLWVGVRVKTHHTTVEQRLAYEAQADDVGGIYGYLAGYDTLGVASEALGAVYHRLTPHSTTS